LINLYGGVAVLLAAVGVYGVLAAAVAGRSRDIGIRSALGADRRRLLSQVLKQGMMIASIAVTIGGVAAWLLSRAFASLLFGVTGGNEGLIAATAVLLIALAALASVIPARRATKVDPIAVLRTD
jgi:ABC-type antimicrobial peptide transport system permease subunit